jgi:hypothetical protein
MSNKYISKGTIVRVRELKKDIVLTDIDPVFQGRRSDIVGTVYAPVNSTVNRRWYVRHDEKCRERGPFTYAVYAAYHDDELEFESQPLYDFLEKKEENLEDDFGFDEAFYEKLNAEPLEDE